MSVVSLFDAIEMQPIERNEGRRCVKEKERARIQMRRMVKGKQRGDTKTERGCDECGYRVVVEVRRLDVGRSVDRIDLFTCFRAFIVSFGYNYL